MEVIVKIRRTKIYENNHITFLSVTDKNKPVVRKRVISFDKKKRFSARKSNVPTPTIANFVEI
jgi:hypothetical protein